MNGFGEGNGNPLQCSCLENPRDGKAWWAAFHGVKKSRTRLKWLNSSSSSRLSWYVSESCVFSPFNCVQLFGTSWTIACLASLFMEFSRQEYWSGLPCPPPEDLPHPGIKPDLFYCRQIIYSWATREGFDIGLRHESFEKTSYTGDSALADGLKTQNHLFGNSLSFVWLSLSFPSPLVRCIYRGYFIQ